MEGELKECIAKLKKDAMTRRKNKPLNSDKSSVA